MADPQWWEPEFAQLSLDTEDRDFWANAIAQGRVTPSYLTPYASGAAEPDYPIESAIFGGAAGRLGAAGGRALLETAARNRPRGPDLAQQQSLSYLQPTGRSLELYNPKAPVYRGDPGGTVIYASRGELC